MWSDGVAIDTFFFFLVKVAIDTLETTNIEKSRTREIRILSLYEFQTVELGIQRSKSDNMWKCF